MEKPEWEGGVAVRLEKIHGGTVTCTTAPGAASGGTATWTVRPSGSGRTRKVPGAASGGICIEMVHGCGATATTGPWAATAVAVGPAPTLALPTASAFANSVMSACACL